MVLKIFTKRTKGGVHVETNLDWKDWIYEGTHVYVKDVFSDGSEGLPKKGEHIGFEFLIKNGEETEKFVLFTDIMGYELINSSGITIEKYVTATE